MTNSAKKPYPSGLPDRLLYKYIVTNVTVVHIKSI